MPDDRDAPEEIVAEVVQEDDREDDEDTLRVLIDSQSKHALKVDCAFNDEGALVVTITDIVSKDN